MSNTQLDLDDELDDDIEIEFEDDTPEEDRGKDRAPEDASDEDDDLPDDDEMRQYNQSAQKRIRQLTKKFHDERRAKEAIARERDQAADFAKNKLSETELLRKQLTQVASGAVGVYKEKHTAEIADLKERLARAVDMGDGKEVAELTEKIADAKESLRSTHDAEENLKRAQEAPQQQTVDPTDPAGWPAVRRKWADENKDWFGIDDEMTALAYATHAKLIKAGVVPDTEEYFSKLSNRVREIFPNYFKDKGEAEEDYVEDDTPAPRKAAPKAAPASKNSGLVNVSIKGGKKVYRLTDSQRALCKRLGISPKDYIAEVNNMGKSDE